MKDKKTLMTAAVVLFAAFASARAETWDFTCGCPADLKPGKGARFIAGGLTAVNPDDSNLAAGCRMKKAFRLPEAFELTAEFTPSAALPPGKSRVGHVWDDMYVNYAPKWRHAGLQLILQHRGDKWQPIAYFGRGDMTEVVSGPAVALQPGRSTKLVLLYDANRRVRLELAGVSLEGALTRAGAITCGFYGTTFGDRFGSSYHPLDVTLSRVSVKALPRESFTILPVSTRLAFVRGEANARIRLTAENFSDGTLSQVRGEMRELTAAGVCVKTASESLADLAAGAVCEFTFPVETRVRPGALQFEITLSAVSADGPLKVRRSLAGAIGPAFLADRMPVLMWGFAAPTSVLADLGFTHGLLYGLGFTAPPRPGADLGVPIRTLDDALANGIRLAKSIGVEFPTNRPESAYYVLARDGTPRMSSSIRNQNVPEVANPDFAATAAKTARANCEVFGDHPAFCGVLPCSERRDHSYPSFNMQDELYRRATGRETPPEVDRRRVANKKDTLKRFPDGVIDEKDPVYQYYRWFWKGGDGWPGYVSAIADAYRAGVGDRKDFFSFWDPAVRCPPLGRGDVRDERRSASRAGCHDHDAAYLLSFADRSVQHGRQPRSGLAGEASAGGLSEHSAGQSHGGGLVDDLEASQGHHVPRLGHDLRDRLGDGVLLHQPRDDEASQASAPRCRRPARSDAASARARRFPVRRLRERHDLPDGWTRDVGLVLAIHHILPACAA